jgi:hypothetical protein
MLIMIKMEVRVLVMMLAMVMVMMMMVMMRMRMMMVPRHKQSFLWSVQALVGAGGSSVLLVRGTDFELVAPYTSESHPLVVVRAAQWLRKKTKKKEKKRQELIVTDS